MNSITFTSKSPQISTIQFITKFIIVRKKQVTSNDIELNITVSIC